MNRKKSVTGIIVWLALIVASFVFALMFGEHTNKESIRSMMRDAVLHEENKISLLGIKAVNPSLISAITVTLILLTAALLIRIFVIPKFKYVPGKFQLVLEQLVGFFDQLAKTNSPERNSLLGAYVFGAGVYIFTGTIFELFGLQAVTTNNTSITLPAPLSDINAAIALGCFSYLIILSGGIAGNKFKGILNTLKEFSLPISMSFRLFGALLSGLLVTELVYYNILS